MRLSLISVVGVFMATTVFSQTDTEFESYLARERAELPVEGELLYNCANVGAYRYGGGSGAVKRIVDADSILPFAKAFQLSISQAGANSWEPQFQSPANAIPLKQGDVLFYIFYIRVLEADDPSGFGKGFFYVQRNQSPWTGLGSMSLTFRPSWQKQYVVARAGEDYPAGSMELTIHLGYQRQKVEVGGIIALNLGQGVDLDDLPRNPLIWDGMEASAAWRAEAASRIERYRKGDLKVIAKNQNGESIKNAQIHVKMTDHAYGFGTFIANLVLQNSTNAKRYQEEFLRLFNRATTPFYMGDGGWGWYASEANRREYRDMAGWLQDNGIVTKGHVLIWPSWTWMPPFFRDYENDPDGMREAIDEHLETLVPTGEEKGLAEWDVVNEPHINHDVMDICGDDIMVHWYNKVRELDARPRLILNEYNILMGGGDPAFQADFERYIELLIDGGAPLGGLGMQCHFDENLPGIPQVLDILDRFAKYDLPIQITEFDIDTRDEEGQAHFTRDFYTAVFSHPVTDKIVMWGFWEGDMWIPNGALIRTDWSFKPNYDVFTDLVFDLWWTDESGLSTREGLYETRGFLGEYTISAAFAGKTASKNITLTKEGATVELYIPTIETGVEDQEHSPIEFCLIQNYPNPFNQTTTITYCLDRAEKIRLSIYSVAGQKIVDLLDEFRPSGEQRIQWNASDQPSGVYLVHLSSRSQSRIMKILLQK